MIFIHYLYTGKQIKDLKDLPVKSASTETAKNAYKSIVAQYGSIDENAHYYHAGRGKWSKHTEEVKAKAKFSLDKLKAHSQLHARTKKIPPVSQARRVIKAKLKGEKLKVNKTSENLKPREIKPTKLKIATDKTLRSKGHIAFSGEYEILQRGNDIYRTKIDNVFDTAGYRMDSRFLATKQAFESNKKYFIDGLRAKLNTGLYGVNQPNKPTPRTTKHMPGMKGKAVTKQIDKPAVKAQAPVKSGKKTYVYASFMRPLGPWFKPGVPFKFIKVTNAHKDPRFNRLPHSVIVTNEPIEKDIQKNLELTNSIEGKKLKELQKYVNSFSYLTDNMKDQLNGLVFDGKVTTRAEVDKYAEKGKKLMDKKASKKPAHSSKFNLSALKVPTGLTKRGVRNSLKVPNNVRVIPTSSNKYPLKEELKADAMINVLKEKKFKLDKEIKGYDEGKEYNKGTKYKELKVESEKLGKDIKQLQHRYDFITSTGEYAVKQVKEPKTLKEISIRLEEINKVLYPLFRANVPTTSFTAEQKALNTEANKLIRKRDGIRSRQDTMDRNKERSKIDKINEGATQAATDKRRVEVEQKKVADKETKQIQKLEEKITKQKSVLDAVNQQIYKIEGEKRAGKIIDERNLNYLLGERKKEVNVLNKLTRQKSEILHKDEPSKVYYQPGYGPK